MKREFIIFGLALFSIMLISTEGYSQKRKKKKDEVSEALDDRSKLSGLTVGSYVSFGFSNGWQLEAQPGVGYKIADFLIAGVGMNYTYASRFVNDGTRSKTEATLIGPRVYAQFNVFGPVYLMGEYQQLYFNGKYKDGIGNILQREKGSDSAFLLGGGYTQAFGEGFGVYTDFMFNVLWKQSIPGDPTYTLPYTVRFGLFYTFP
ncbi:MAG: hypothetical protein ACPG5P_07885 [Saprospiraceae bacterium]